MGARVDEVGPKREVAAKQNRPAFEGHQCLAATPKLCRGALAFRSRVLRAVLPFPLSLLSPLLQRYCRHHFDVVHTLIQVFSGGRA